MTDETTNAEPSGASGGSLANYPVIPNSCLRGSTVEQRFCEPTVAGSTPAAGLYVQWIPVSERLPDEYEHVLGWKRTWCRAAEVWRNAHGEWQSPTSLYVSANGISHWMPLPAPPTDAK